MASYYHAMSQFLKLLMRRNIMHHFYSHFVSQSKSHGQPDVIGMRKYNTQLKRRRGVAEHTCVHRRAHTHTQTTLLRYNLHSIQFTILKCIVQWYLVYSQLYNHHQNQFLKTFYHAQKSYSLFPHQCPQHWATISQFTICIYGFAFSRHFI